MIAFVEHVRGLRYGMAYQHQTRAERVIGLVLFLRDVAVVLVLADLARIQVTVDPFGTSRAAEGYLTTLLLFVFALLPVLAFMLTRLLAEAHYASKENAHASAR